MNETPTPPTTRDADPKSHLLPNPKTYTSVPEMVRDLSEDKFYGELSARNIELEAENTRLAERVRELESIVGMVRYCQECGHCPCCQQRGKCDDDCDMAKERAAKLLEEQPK